MKSSKEVDERKEGIGQNELYSPEYAIKIINPKEGENSSNTMVGIDIKNRMMLIKYRLLDKLRAASVPSDALENARNFFESVIRDVTSAAQGLTKDALQRIKSHLADILPSLSPSLTSKMVDDAEKEVEGERGRDEDQATTENASDQHKGKVHASPMSSLFSSYQAKLGSKL